MASIIKTKPLKHKILTLAIAQALLISSAHAATITVTSADDNTIDDSVCTLREAIISANNDDNSAETACTAGSGADTIEFDSTLANSTITLGSSLTTIRSDLTIDAYITGYDMPTITLEGSNGKRIMSAYSNVSNQISNIYLNGLTLQNGSVSKVGAGLYLNANSGLNNFSTTLSNSVVTGNSCTKKGCGIYARYSNLSLSHVTVSNNATTNTGLNGAGGGIFVSLRALTIDSSTISGNTGSQGGGIAFNSPSKALTISNSTISGNTASGSANLGKGGGIYSSSGSTSITNSTIVDNAASNTADGLYMYAGNLTLINSIIANNNSNADCNSYNYINSGSETSFTITNTLIQDGGIPCSTATYSGDPYLDSLADNGGDSLTHLPIFATSPVIDAGNNTNCGSGLTIDVDQRGFARDDGSCDIGAVELRPQFSWDSTAYSVTESDGSVTLTVNFSGSLNDTTIDYATADNTAVAPTDYTSDTNTLTFSAGTTSQTITLNITDDSTFESSEDFSVTLSNPQYSSAGTQSLDVASASSTTIIIGDNDQYTLSSSILSTTELGTTDSFTLVLNSAPTADVNVTLNNNDTTEGSLDNSALTFTTANWNTAQTVTVTGVDDNIDDGDITYSINITLSSSDNNFSSAAGSDVLVTNNDDDTAGVSLSSTSLSTNESTLTDSFTVVLDSQPTADVTVSFTNNDTTEGALDSSSLTFTAANWNITQTVTVSGVNDDIDDGDITYTINVTTSSSDSNYSGLSAADISVTNSDDDTAGISLNTTSLSTSESASTDSFTVVLDSEPTNNVTVGFTNNDTTEGSLDSSSLIFTAANWNTTQTVTLTGVDDNVDDDDITYTINVAGTSTDINYSGITASDISATNSDNDTAGISVSTSNAILTTSENGVTTDTISVVLNSEPVSSVTVPLTVGDTTEGSLDASSLTFNSANWNTAQTVTVSGVDDSSVDGSVAYTITINTASSSDGNYNSLSADTSSITVINSDDDVVASSAGINLSTYTVVTSEDATSSSFRVVLNAQPSADVIITLTNGDSSEGSIDTSSLTFTSSNWDTEQTVTVTGVDDTDVDGLIAYGIDLSVSSADSNFNGLSIPNVIGINSDNDSSSSNSSSGAISVWMLIMPLIMWLRRKR